MSRTVLFCLFLPLSLSFTACVRSQAGNAKFPASPVAPTRAAALALSPMSSSSAKASPSSVAGHLAGVAEATSSPSSALTGPMLSAIPSGASEAVGGIRGSGGAPVDAMGDTWTEDPLEPVVDFDPVTAEGTGTVGGASVRIRWIEGGCMPAGGSATGSFEVMLVGDSVSAPQCADYGQTVRVGNVAVVFGTEAADVLDGKRIPSGIHALVYGFGGDDTIVPADGAFDNYIVAGTGDDAVRPPLADGDHGALIFGGDGADMLQGTAGRDFIVGGEGADTIVGGSGQDELHGGPGADTLDACPGDLAYDLLVGGPEADDLAIAFLAGNPVDALYDYERGEIVRDCDGAVVVP